MLLQVLLILVSSAVSSSELAVISCVAAALLSAALSLIHILLLESGFKVPSRNKKIAYLIEKGVEGQALCDVIAKAQEARKDGTQVLVARMNKNKKFQKEQLTAEGYEEFQEFYKNPLN